MIIWLIVVSYTVVKGQQPYNSVKQNCCNGKVYSRDESKLCCNGTLVDTDPLGKGNSVCCGNNAVKDDPTKLCCNGKMVPKPLNSVDGQELYYDCCGSEAYITSKQICCGNRIEDNISGLTACCGNRVYNYQKSLCCDGVISNVKDSYACCGNKTYNILTQVCCYETSTAIDVPPKSTCPINTYSCCRDKLVLPGQQCCNGAIFNSSTIVVNGYPQSSYCCFGGGIVQNASAEICCDRGVVPVDRPGQGCCGTQLYDYTYQGCCGTQHYDFKHQGCCGSTVYNRNPERYFSCCGEEPYEYETQFCCGGKVSNINEEYNACCDVWFR